MKTLPDNPKNEYFRDMYAWRKAHHICTKCGQEDAAKGRTRCINCLEKCRGQIRKPLTTEQRYAKHIRQKRRYDLLTAFGVCTKDGIERKRERDAIYFKGLTLQDFYRNQ